MACPYGLTEDGFETQIGTNHFGHFLLFQLLKPTLLASSTPEFHSRVINVSSAGHHLGKIRYDDINFSSGDYSPLAGYGQSKLANVYMANSIERHYGSQGLHGLSLHPGVIMATELSRHLTPEMLASFASEDGYWEKYGKSVEQGAATTAWAAVEPKLEGKGGVYLADVGEASPATENEAIGGPGYAAFAYDEEAEEKLWELSNKLVGITDE